MRARAAMAALAIALLGSSMAGQQPAVTFRVQVNFVEIDAIVTDRDGRFVRDLTPEDFQVVEEGKPQKIAAFSMVDIPVVRPEAAPDAPSTGVVSVTEPDVSSNAREFDGRVFLLVLDDLQTGLSRSTHVRRAAREFIERHAGENDLVAVAQTGGTAHNQDFTANRARLFAAIDRFAGQKLRSATALYLEDRQRQETLPFEARQSPRDTEDAVRADHARRSLRALKEFSTFLGGIRGRRKVLVYFGEGIDYDMMPRVTTSLKDVPEMSRDLRGMHEALQEVVRTATRNNVSIYAIDPRGLTTGMEEAIGMIEIARATSKSQEPPKQAVDLLRQELSRAHDVLKTIAEESGGAAFLNTNDTGPGLARIINDSSSYYILGYYAPEGRRDGRFRRVEVRVKRPGLQVRARRGYFAPAATTPAAKPRPRGALSAELFEAMQNPLPLSGLAFTVAAVPFQGGAFAASVAVILEIHPGRLGFTERNGTLARMSRCTSPRRRCGPARSTRATTWRTFGCDGPRTRP